jgi:hypothetical protein
MHRGFSQVEGRFALLKFSFKAFDALKERFSRKVLEENLNVLAGVLDIPEEIKTTRIGVGTPQL